MYVPSPSLDSTYPSLTLTKRTIGKRSAEAQSYKLDWAHGADCAVKKFPGCIGLHGEDADSEESTAKAEVARRWINPPPTIPTGFGTECSLETCDMCPTFPGCGGGEMKAGNVLANENWAQPPAEKREDSATGGMHVKSEQEQPSTMGKREAWISPIMAGGVNVGVGPECSIYTCDMCPDHPGCENGGTEAPPKGA